MTQENIGKVFNGRYKLTERIGTGGMAEVYRAEDAVLGRVVAVKVMLQQYAQNPEFTDRFRQEAASAANLQNPYIVNIYDWGQDGNDYFIVMEYVRGSDLKTGIKTRGPLPQRRVAEISNQVCQALGTAHNQDIIHRDIKPQNIMVQPDGNIKVMDFGIARAKNSVKTQTSSVLGTAHYISPEQAQGKEITPASDIYSLGCVMYEAATGVLPFDGPDAVSVAMKQVNEKPKAPRSIKPDIDPDLEKIIGMAMNKDPQRRFATAKDMQNALETYLSGRPLDLNGSSAAKTAVIAGGAGLAGAALGAGIASAQAPDKTGVMPSGSVRQTSGSRPSSYRSGNPNTKNKKKPKSKKKIVIFLLILALIGIGVFCYFTFFAGENVPDLVGKDVEQAKSLIKDAGFEVGSIDKVYDDKSPNQVVRQNPNGNSKANKGTKINLVISLGPEMVVVPDVLGKTRSEAQDILEKAGFKVVLGEEQYSKYHEAGKIMTQDPEGETSVAKGSTITLIVSKGSDSVNVPNVVNYSESNATSTLRNAGFEVDVEREYSDTVDKGLVISQSPRSGQKLEKGTNITIVVSLGKNPESEKVSVPSVVGMTLSAARSALQAAGFTVNVDSTAKDTDVVTSQSPDAGSKVADGTSVTLVCKKAT